jgi:hypothetical protein
MRRIQTNTLVRWFAWFLAYGGPALLLMAMAVDPTWVRQLPALAVMLVAAIVLRATAVPLGKYAYTSPLGLLAVSGSLLVGSVPTALAVGLGTGLADRLIQRKGGWPVLVNSGREVISVLAAYGFYGLVSELTGGGSPLSAEGFIGSVVFVTAYFFVNRTLFYYSLMVRQKLGTDEQLIILRYEIAHSALLILASALVIATVVVLPLATWPFVGAFLVFGAVLAKQMGEEVVQAEELNKRSSRCTSGRSAGRAGRMGRTGSKRSAGKSSRPGSPLSFRTPGGMPERWIFRSRCDALRSHR